MDNRQAEKILHDLNKWRRGGKGEMPDPRLVGKAIDAAIVLFRKVRRNSQNFAKEETSKKTITNFADYEHKQNGQRPDRRGSKNKKQ